MQKISEEKEKELKKRLKEAFEKDKSHTEKLAN